MLEGRARRAGTALDCCIASVYTHAMANTTPAAPIHNPAFRDLGFTQLGHYDYGVDVGSIRYRLHPIDVGFDLREHDMPCVIGAERRLRVSYPEHDGRQWVVEGPRESVIAYLTSLGFTIVDGVQ